MMSSPGWATERSEEEEEDEEDGSSAVPGPLQKEKALVDSVWDIVGTSARATRQVLLMSQVQLPAAILNLRSE